MKRMLYLFALTIITVALFDSVACMKRGASGHFMPLPEKQVEASERVVISMATPLEITGGQYEVVFRRAQPVVQQRVQHVQQNRELSTLGINLSDIDVLAVCGAIPCLGLKTLTCNCSHLNEQNMTQLARAIAHSTTLEKVLLLKVSDGGSKIVAEMLKVNKHLQRLVIGLENRAEDVSELVAAVKQNTTLTSMAVLGIPLEVRGQIECTLCKPGFTLL